MSIFGSLVAIFDKSATNIKLEDYDIAVPVS